MPIKSILIKGQLEDAAQRIVHHTQVQPGGELGGQLYEAYMCVIETFNTAVCYQGQELSPAAQCRNLRCQQSTAAADRMMPAPSRLGLENRP